MDYFNPYSESTFFEFFGILAHRLWLFVTGNELVLASDELQILVLMGLSISSALVGAFLVFRKMAMLANSLSHTILPGVVFAFVVQHLSSGEAEAFSGSLPSGVLLIASACLMACITTFLTETCTRLLRIHPDASTGIVFTFLFAIGVIAVTVISRNAHIGAELLMGNVDALRLDDLYFCTFTALLNSVIFFIWFRPFVVSTFDPIFARGMGIRSSFFGYLLMIQTAVTSIAAFRAIGVLLFLAFLVTPPLIARILSKRINKVIFLSVFMGCANSLIGVALSRHFLSVYAVALSTSGLVVCLLAITYLLSRMYTHRIYSLKIVQNRDNEMQLTKDTSC